MAWRSSFRQLLHTAPALHLARTRPHTLVVRTRPALTASLLAGVGTFGANRASCEDKADAAEDAADALQQQLISGGTSLSFGGAMGFCTGALLKRLSKVAMVAVGGVFVMFQSAANAGYITIDWQKVSDDFTSTLDLDGDGKVDEKDLKILMTQGTQMLTANMATSAAGFTTGLLLGIKKG